MQDKLQSSTQFVDLSRWSFAIWWTIVLIVHLVTGGYNATFALFYWELQHTYLYLCLEYSGIGMLAKDHHTIAVVYAVLAALHGVCILQMVSGSLWRRELSFSPRTKTKARVYRVSKFDSTDNAAEIKAKADALPRTRLVRLYSKVLGRRGLVGVNGKNFHAILIAREFVETALQTVQAYRMSWLLPRMLLNRFYLSLIVLNCWSSVLVYSLLFRRNEARKRFAYIVVDCILNLVSSIGVPLIVVITYIGQYDTQLTGFALENWYDDEWSARVLNEFQMILVVSWMDLASRVVFSLGVLATTSSLKDLLRRSSGASLRRIACDAADTKTPNNEERLKSNPTTSSGIVLPHESRNCRARSGRLIMHSAYGIFALWGVAVIGLHIQASIQPEQPQCALQVRPWAVSNPACYLAVLDCNRLDISGKKDEVEQKWNEFDRSTVVTLVIRHCPALEVPDSIGDFHLTTGIKVYNSTINEWGESAAITNSNHPELIWFYFVRVDVKDGVLPAGALSADFPGKLYDLEFTYTNIRDLPDDLDSKWLIGTTVYFEYSELTSVPPSLLRLEPYSLSLTGSPITDLPPEVFEIAGLTYLSMGNLPIHELPHNVTELSPQLMFLYMVDTNISFFWSWIDPFVESTLEWGPELFNAGSKYCTDLDKIKRGEVDAFSALPSSEYSIVLMNASETNREVILRAVNCDPQDVVTVYPIDFEDSISALS